MQPPSHGNITPWLGPPPPSPPPRRRELHLPVISREWRSSLLRNLTCITFWRIENCYGPSGNFESCRLQLLHPDPQLLHGFKRHAGSTLLRALFVLTNLDITQKMKRLLAVKYVTSDKWCNLCFATTNGILTCQHGLVLDLSGILVTSSPPPQRASRPNLQVGTLGKHPVKPWDNVGSGWIKFHRYCLYCKKNWWNPEMLGQCLRRFQSIHQQSAERNPWLDVSIFPPDWTWNTSLTILVQKTEQHAAGSQSIGSQQDSARKIDFILFGCEEFWYLDSCWSPLVKLCK